MKIHVSELPENSCFKQKRAIRKKLAGGKAASVRKGGKISIRSLRGDPKVTPVPCPLKFLGVGLRGHPDMVVEIGDGNILRRRKR